jgi:hypothetical protein
MFNGSKIKIDEFFWELCVIKINKNVGGQSEKSYILTLVKNPPLKIAIDQQCEGNILKHYNIKDRRSGMKYSRS